MSPSPVAAANETPEAVGGPGPQRLDPRTLLLYGVRSFGPMLVLATPAVVSLWREDDPMRTVIGLAIVGSLGLLLLAVGTLFTWLSWRAFTYEVRPGEVVIARGVIHRSRRSIPVERIQDVSITRRPLSRLLGLAEVRIETGGADADEGKLNSVSLAEAHRLRAVLRALGVAAAAGRERGVEPAESAPAAPAPVDNETVVYRLGGARLILAGLFSFSLVWIVAPLGLLEYAGRVFDIDAARWASLLLDLGEETHSRLSPALVLGAVGVAGGAGVLAGLVQTVLRDFGFTLTRAEGRLRSRRGLLTRSEVVVAVRRIQLGLIEHGTVAGRLGWRMLRVQTLGGGDGESGRQTLAPFARPAEVEALLPLAGLPVWSDSGLRPVSSRHMIGGVIEALPLAVILLVATVVWPPAAAAGPLLLLPLWVALRRPRAHRYSLTPPALQVQRGVLTRRDWIVPWHRIQAVTLRRGPLQRRLGLATLCIDTAGVSRGYSQPHIHDLDEGDAVSLARLVLARVEEARQAAPPLQRLTSCSAP